MDNRVLVIVAHPDLADASRVHKRWVAELAKHPDEFVVRDLYALYPDGTLDEAAIEAEHALLDEHDTIVFQFPVYWYSSPALLRTWTDAVYGFGWAYGGDQAAPGELGRKLAGKHFALALSAGDIEANYCKAGTVGFTYSQIIIPFRATANYVGATCDPEPFVLSGTENGLTDEELEANTTAYVEWLRAL